MKLYYYILLSCIDQFRDEVGHFREALSGADVDDWSRAFDWDFVDDYRDKFSSYDQQWDFLKDADYWSSVTSSSEIFDFVLNFYGDIVRRTYFDWW